MGTSWTRQPFSLNSAELAIEKELGHWNLFHPQTKEMLANASSWAVISSLLFHSSEAQAVEALKSTVKITYYFICTATATSLSGTPITILFYREKIPRLGLNIVVSIFDRSHSEKFIWKRLSSKKFYTRDPKTEHWVDRVQSTENISNRKSSEPIFFGHYKISFASVAEWFEASERPVKFQVWS